MNKQNRSLRTIIFLLIASSILVVASGSAYGDKVCINVTVNKRLKTSIKSRVAASCPKGFTELLDTSSLGGNSPFGPLPSGTTVRGVLGGWGNTSNLSFVTESLPAAAGRPIKTSDMIIAHTPRLVSYCNSTYPNGLEDCLSPEELEKDETLCTGSFNSPTAPRGKVCIYVDVLYMAYDLNAQLVAAEANPAAGSPYGFGVQWFTASGTSKVKATWAYTAP